MTTDRKYAFLMIDYETPEFIKDLHNKITDDELYTEENSSDYGKETVTHVTVVPCLNNDVKVDNLKKYLEKLFKYELIITNISVFENEKYDVLKCDVKSKYLEDTNRNILNDFETHSEYKEYHPHVTIAYLKKGIGEKYKKNTLNNIIKLKPKSFHFSYIDENGKSKEIKFS